MRSRTVLAVAVAGLVVGSCGGGASSDTTSSGETATDTAPFHAVDADAVVVSGSADCEFSNEGAGEDGEEGNFLVICELDLSDQRVTGTERHDRFQWAADGVGGTLWLVEDATITNPGGTWRGSVQAAEDREAIPTGEAHYVGEDAYAGLEFHYYFFHADLGAPAEIRGWITSGE